MKKLLAVLVGFLICLTIIPSFIFAAENEGENALDYSTEDLFGTFDYNNIESPILFTEEPKVEYRELMQPTNGKLSSRSSIGWKDHTKVSSWTEKSKVFLRWHPAFFGKNYNISYYNFSNSSTSISVALGGAYRSVSVSYSPKGSGYSIKANPKKWSRPAIYGDLIATKYRVKSYTGAGKLISTTYVTYYHTTKTYIKILY
ncbi:hypothetical protein [Peribacillus phoenicis]|uniref:hypothetical protein n=1 Tax=unclassified Peribacillus TaxID=2675266 RepID=UPI0039A0A4E7